LTTPDFATPGLDQNPEAGYLTADEIVDAANSDLKETDVEDVFGGKVRIRALTASQADAVNQNSIKLGNSRRQSTQYSFAASSLLKFQYGVVLPKLTKDQVRTLHIKSGPSFQTVLKAIDELSNIDRDSLERDEDEFRGPDE